MKDGGKITDKVLLERELGDDDKSAIREAFMKHVVPKLARLNARNGVISCEFAAPEYKNWQVHFRSVGAEFDIVEFEYDEEGEGLDLDL
jgi:hypothetical protein